MGRLGRGLAAALLLFLVGCASTPEEGVTHVVRPGENLYRISRYYGVDVQRVIRANRVGDVTALAVGTRLFIPGASKSQPERPITPAPGALARTPGGRDRTPGGRERARREANVVLGWPLSGRVSSGFGWRSGRRHEGIDILAKKGTPVHAAAAGRVIHSGRLGDYGNVVIVKHAGRYSTVYAHNQRNRVPKGAFVEKGQAIANVGKTGNATAFHLHFEVRRDRVAQDPLRYLPDLSRTARRD